MKYIGSCHCGDVQFEATGDLDKAVECNCSHCSKKGFLLWFVPRDQFVLKTPEDKLTTYTFNTHKIKHQFCARCGCAPFGFGEGPSGSIASVNLRCVEDIDLSAVEIQPVDGKNF